MAFISPEALSQLIDKFNAAGDAKEYRPQPALSDQEDSISEADTLKSKRQTLETGQA